MTNKIIQTHQGHRQRLRQKFTAAGLEPFLDHEVLELLLTYAIARKDKNPWHGHCSKNLVRFQPY